MSRIVSTPSAQIAATPHSSEQRPSPGSRGIPTKPETLQITPEVSAIPTPTPADPNEVPAAGSGQFFAVAGSGTRTGESGQLIRYNVIIEGDSSANDPVGSPEEFASTIEATLADPRGWTSHGQWSFQRVNEAEGTTEMIIHLATPATTDTICASHGLNTGGEVSCRGGPDVVINLKRWMLGVPWYADSLLDYRRMVLNHEIGHYLGHGHEGCPGPGQLAPIMQTQTHSLDGCIRNPWPYPPA